MIPVVEGSPVLVAERPSPQLTVAGLRGTSTAKLCSHSVIEQVADMADLIAAEQR
jgi:hypothetical protein